MENALAVNEPNMQGLGMYSSVTAETREELLDIYDAVSNSKPLNDLINLTIAVQDVIIQPVEIANEETGEVKSMNRVTLVTPEGEAYSCTSSGVETSLKNLFSIVGMPPYEPAIVFDVKKKKGKKYEFTTLVIHREK